MNKKQTQKKNQKLSELSFFNNFKAKPEGKSTRNPKLAQKLREKAWYGKYD